MKKLIILGVLIMTGMVYQSARAQFDYIGGGIALSTGGEFEFEEVIYNSSSFGFDLRMSYNYSKKLKIVPDFKFYIPYKNEVFVEGGSKVTAYALNINAHYLLSTNPREKYRFYLLAGFHLGGWSIKDNSVVNTTILDVNEFKIFPGGNVGAGMQFDIGNRTKFFAEAKFVIAQTQKFVFTPGLIYNI